MLSNVIVVVPAEADPAPSRAVTAVAAKSITSFMIAPILSGAPGRRSVNNVFMRLTESQTLAASVASRRAS